MKRNECGEEIIGVAKRKMIQKYGNVKMLDVHVHFARSRSLIVVIPRERELVVVKHANAQIETTLEVAFPILAQATSF